MTDYPEVRTPTFKEKIDSYISTRLPETATKIGRVIIAFLIKIFRFVVSLFKEAFNKA